MNENAPSFAAPSTFPTHTSLELPLRILQPLSVERARLQPYGRHTCCFGFTEDAERDGWLGDYAQRGFGGVWKRGRRGDGGVGSVGHGYAGTRRRDGLNGKGAGVVPCEYWVSSLGICSGVGV